MDEFAPRAGLEKLSVLPVLDRFLSLKTDFVLNRKQENLSIKIRFFPSNSKDSLYNSYLSRQFTVKADLFNPFVHTHVLHDLGVSSADHTDVGMKRVGPLYTACRVEGLVRLCSFLLTASY